MYNQLENSPPQQPSRVSPTFANPMSIVQNPTIQQQSSYGNRSSFGQGTASVQDYTSRQQLNPSPPNNPSSFAMNHARHHSAQSMYGTAIPQMLQTPSDNSRFSMYSTNSHGTTQEMEFDASILYSSPVSASPTSAVPFSSPAPISPIFQPQRRQMTLNDSESFTTPNSNQATNHLQSQSVQVSNPATRRFQPQNVLRRRKTKAAAALSAIPPIPQPPATLQKPNEVPVYSLVAQAPLDATMKPTTPSFQTQLYSKPPVPSLLPDLSSNSNQNSGPLQQNIPPRTLSLPPLTISNQQGLFMSQYPSSAPTGSMTIPQQPLSPLRAQNTGGSHVIPPVSYMNSQVPSLMQANSHSTLGLSNGIMGAPLNPIPMTMNHTPSLMSMSSNAQLDGSSNGTTGPMNSIPPLTYNQPLDGFSNGSMTLSGAPLVSPTLIPTQPPQPNSFSNGLLGNNAMAQPSLPMPPPQQSNMLSNGYALGLPSSASVAQMQGEMIGQSPGVMGQPTAAQQKAVPKDNKNNQLMKKVGMSFGKAVLKFGTKYALEQIGVDGGALFAFFLQE